LILQGIRIHFIGIGGYGMSGLARVFLEMGSVVSGSDVKASERTEKLAHAGARVFIGHHPQNINGAEWVVYNTDVPPDNVELVEAQKKGLRVMHRSELLSLLINERKSIAITGTHGKTTTTAMTALALEVGGLDPTVLIGGETTEFNGNAKLGRSPYLVAEADESDASFLRYRPLVAVITNIEPEHLEHYGGDFNRLVEAFRQFAQQVRPGGRVVLGWDNPTSRGLAEALDPSSVVTFGFCEGAELRAVDLREHEGGNTATLVRNGRRLGNLGLKIPGKHNIANALAAAAASLEVGIPFDRIRASLARFQGVKRRFQVIGRSRGILVVDDYAHHPTEIRATLAAAREGNPERVVAVFQPQRYVRTGSLMEEFSRSFDLADEVVLAEIYAPPGEKPIPGVSSYQLGKLVEGQTGQVVPVFDTKEEVLDYLLKMVRPGDTVLTMGAGDIWKIAHRLAEVLREQGQGFLGRRKDARTDGTFNS